MKLIVIGATSYIGSHIYSLANSKNIKTLGTQRNDGRLKLRHFDLLNSFPSYIYDFTNTEERTYAVICSAIARIDECKNRPEYCYNVNVTATKRLIDNLLTLGIIPVFLSSDAVYEGNTGNYIEQNEKKPVTVYGCHKAEIEDYLAKKTDKHLIFRLCKNIGYKPKERHIFSEWYQKALMEEPIYCIENQTFSTVMVDDVAEAILHACQDGLKGVYNLSSREVHSRYGLATTFFNKLCLKADVQTRDISFFRFLDKRPLTFSICSDKFVNETGFVFETTAQTIQKFSAHVGHRDSESHQRHPG
ncbi:MAG: sugar nucleotide-binding protein [Deltaproteobacteria bacterium]|nr:sugar nucleotide-binding protein [Deltaproteobacteria bacterium]